LLKIKTRIYPVLLSEPRPKALTADGSNLPLGTLMAYLKAHDGGALHESYEFMRLVIRSPEKWCEYEQFAENDPPGVWLFSSYSWNHTSNLQVAEKVKAASPDSLIIFGGPHVPAYEEENRQFMIDHPFVDIAVRGEGEVTLAEILEMAAKADESLHGDFTKVNGLACRTLSGLFRTPDRVRTRDLDKFPSPYLTGEFDDESFNNLPVMILETNRGCPFGCTFCDWGSATSQKFSLFDLDRVKEEIELIAKKGAFSLYLGDSNFGAFERDIEIAQVIADMKKKYGYPKKFGTSFAKNASPKLAEIIKILSKGNLLDAGLISIQTTDEETLSAINRSNIRNEKYEQLIDIFKQEKLNLSSELLIGLPGQTVQSHKEDLQFFIDRKLMTIAYCTAVMPNAPMNEPGYRKRYDIETNEDGYVVSTSSFTAAQHSEMLKLFLAFEFYYVLSILKYFCYYMQVEHSVRVMDFIEDFLEATEASPKKYPLNSRVCNELLTMKREWSPCLEWSTEESRFLFDHLDDYYAEVLRFVDDKYSVVLDDSVKQTLVDAQKAVMPALGKTLPMEVNLQHDLIAFIDQIKALRVISAEGSNFKSLTEFPSAVLHVSTRKNADIKDISLAQFNRYTGAGWELKSGLRFF